MKNNNAQQSISQQKTMTEHGGGQVEIEVTTINGTLVQSVGADVTQLMVRWFFFWAVSAVLFFFFSFQSIDTNHKSSGEVKN
jgi:hypothetical protein